MLTGLEAPKLIGAFWEAAPPHLHLLVVVSKSPCARCPGAPLHRPLPKMGNVGLASSLPPTRSRPLGARRRLRARLARPPTPWHGFALPLVAPPSWRSRSRSMVVTALAHQLAGPPSPPSSLFRSLVAGEKWDRERGIWKLGSCPSLPIGASSYAGNWSRPFDRTAQIRPASGRHRR